MNTLFLIIVLIIGLAVGSFLNVVIYRIPQKKSIILPSSRCPACEHKLKAWENIPLLSYIYLKGKCSQCGAKLSLEYPLIELTTGLLFVISFIKFDITNAISACFFISIVLVAGMIDSKHQIIPNIIVLPGILVGFILLFLSFIPNWNFVPLVQGSLLAAFLQSLIGCAIGFGILFIVALVKAGGMGGGDIKLAAFMGIFLGWYVILALFLGFLFGALVGVLLILFKKQGRKEPISFGPFLALGSLITLFYGPQVYHLYKAIWF